MADDRSGTDPDLGDTPETVPGLRPDWVSDELFPFESRFVEIDGHIVHYVDEGEGPPLVMYHGNPTWSFVYRTVIDHDPTYGASDDALFAMAELYREMWSRFGRERDLRRAIHYYEFVADRWDNPLWRLFDYPGFGLSRAAPGYDFAYRSHLGVATAFVERLGLSDITAFVQDWGGPIGLGVAARHPEHHRALVMGNTFAWPVEDRMWRAVSWLIGGPPGRLLVDRGNFLARTVGNAHRLRSLDPDERAHYVAPFPTPETRRATRAFIAGLRFADPDLRELAARLPSIGDLPTLILWGTSDRFYGRREQHRLESLFPNHTTHVLEGAGHFLQSDAGEDVAAAIASWFSTVVESGR